MDKHEQTRCQSVNAVSTGQQRDCWLVSAVSNTYLWQQVVMIVQSQFLLSQNPWGRLRSCQLLWHIVFSSTTQQTPRLSLVTFSRLQLMCVLPLNLQQEARRRLSDGDVAAA